MEELLNKMVVELYNLKVGELVDIREKGSIAKLDEWNVEGNNEGLVSALRFAFLNDAFYARPAERDGVKGIEFMTRDELTERVAKIALGVIAE